MDVFYIVVITEKLSIMLTTVCDVFVLMSIEEYCNGGGY